MPELTVRATLPASASVVVRPFATVLHGYAERDDFRLSVALGIAGGQVTVPVCVGLPEGTGAPSVRVLLAARRHTDWFPSFDGVLRIEAHDALTSVLSMSGTYRLPLHYLGTAVDRTVLGRAAEHSLRTFVERLREEVLMETRRSELGVRGR